MSSPQPGPGHNSGTAIDSAIREALKRYVDRIEGLEAEKRDLQADVKEVYSEAKNQGFDVNVLRKLIRRRQMKPHEREEEDQLLELYEGVFA